MIERSNEKAMTRILATLSSAAVVLANTVAVTNS